MASNRCTALFARMLGLTLCILLLSGCGALDVDVLVDREKGDQAFRELTQSITDTTDAVKEGVVDMKDGAVGEVQTIQNYTIPSIWYKTCQFLKRWGAVVAVGSILLSMVLKDLFVKNLEIRQFSLLTFGIKIPLVTVFIVYLACFVYGLLDGRIVAVAEQLGKIKKYGFPELWYEWANGLEILIYFSLITVYIICVVLLFSKTVSENRELRDFIVDILMKKIPMIVALIFIIYPKLFYMFN